MILFIFLLGLPPHLIAQEYFSCLSNPNTGCPPENPECGFEQANAPCQNPVYYGVRLYTGPIIPAIEECERNNFPVHFSCTVFPSSCASNLSFHALEVKFRVLGDGIFEGVVPTYEVPVDPNTQQLTTFSYLNEREFKWIIQCYEQPGGVFQHQFPIGDLSNIIPLFHLNVLADPGTEIQVEVDYVNIIGIDFVNPTACDDDCCAFPENPVASVTSTPADCTQNIVANLKQLNTPNPAEEIWYSVILENNSGAPVNYNSLDFRLRFDDLHETIPDIGISFPGDLPSQKEENFDENGSAPGETATFYYRFTNGILPAGETAMLDIVILDPVEFENLLGEGNLTLEFIRLNTNAGCCQMGGLPLTNQVVFPGILACENGVPVVRIGPLANPPAGECKTGFTVQFLSSGDMTVERLYMEFDIETSGVLAFSEIIPGDNSLACMATCPGNCVAECSTNHIVIDFSDSGNPLLINNQDYFEIIFDGNNGGITEVTLTSLEFDQVNEDPCIPAVSFDPSLQFPIEKCDYCDEVTADIGAYAGTYTLDDNCEEGFSVYMDFGSTLVDRLTVEFTLQVMGTGTVTINGQASDAFCDAYNNACDPGAGTSNCLEINGNTVVLDLCYASATALGNDIRIIDLVLNGTGTVSGVTITKLEVHTCDPPNYNPCQGEVCDVRYLGAAAGVFPLVPTQNPSICPDEWTIAGGIRGETNLPNPPNCCGVGDGIGDVEVCITTSSIFPVPYDDDPIQCTNPVSAATTAPGNNCDGMYGQTFMTNANLLYVTPIKDCDPLNGVTTFDLVLISRHILGVQALNSPYKIIAADANHSNSVTTFDLVALRKLILFIDADFPNNTSWRFIDAGYTFPDPGNPFETPFREEIVVTESQNPAMNIDFIGVKIGDVNNNAGLCDACGPGFAPPGGGGESMFLKLMDDGAMTTGEVRTFGFALQSEKDLAAWQTGIRFDPEVFEFLGTEASALTGFSEAGNFGLTEVADGKIRALWFAENVAPLNFRSAEGVIRLRFKALKNVEDVTRAISLDDEILQNLAYDESGTAFRVRLKTNRTGEISFTATVEQITVQAIPNPFNNEVIFSLHLPEESPVEITLYDIYGRLAASWQGSLDAGKSSVPFRETNSWGSGVFTYLVKTPLQTLTGTIVKQ